MALPKRNCSESQLTSSVRLTPLRKWSGNPSPATLDGGWQGEIFNRRKDGSDFPISLSTSVVRNDDGEPIALIGVTSDITERKKEEIALHRQNAYLAALHETTLSLISRLDLKDLLGTLLQRAADLLNIARLSLPVRTI